MLAQQGHRLGVERDPPHLVGLRVLLDADTAVQDVVPADLDRLGRRSRRPASEGRRPRRAACRSSSPARRACPSRRRARTPRRAAVRRRPATAGRARVPSPADAARRGRGSSDPVPPDGRRQGPADDRVDLPDGGCGHRSADVRTHFDSPQSCSPSARWLDGRPAVATHPATPQLAVERLQSAGGQLVERDDAERRERSFARCSRRRSGGSCPPTRPSAATHRGRRLRVTVDVGARCGPTSARAGSASSRPSAARRGRCPDGLAQIDPLAQ